MLNWLLDSHSFVSKANYVNWTNNMVVLYQLANYLVALACIAMPLSLLTLWFKVKSIKTLNQYNTWVLILFVIFMLLCAASRLTHVFAFFWPAYRLFIVVELITAVSYIITAIILPLVVYDWLRSFSNDTPTN